MFHTTAPWTVTDDQQLSRAAAHRHRLLQAVTERTVSEQEEAGSARTRSRSKTGERAHRVLRLVSGRP